MGPTPSTPHDSDEVSGSSYESQFSDSDPIPHPNHPRSYSKLSSPPILLSKTNPSSLPSKQRTRTRLPFFVSRPELDGLRERLIGLLNWSAEKSRLGKDFAYQFSFREKLAIVLGVSGGGKKGGYGGGERPGERLVVMLQRVKMRELVKLWRESVRVRVTGSVDVANEGEQVEEDPALEDSDAPPIGERLFLWSIVEYVLFGRYWSFELRKEEGMLLEEAEGDSENEGEAEDDDEFNVLSEWEQDLLRVRGRTGRRRSSRQRCPLEELPFHLLQYLCAFLIHDYESLQNGVGRACRAFREALLSTWREIRISSSTVYKVPIRVVVGKWVRKVMIVMPKFMKKNDFRWVWSLVRTCPRIEAIGVCMQVGHEEEWDEFEESLNGEVVLPSVRVFQFGSKIGASNLITLGSRDGTGAKLSVLCPNLEIVAGRLPNLSICHGLEKLKYVEVDGHLSRQCQYRQVRTQAGVAEELMEFFPGLSSCPRLREFLFGVTLIRGLECPSFADLAEVLTAAFSHLTVERLDLWLREMVSWKPDHFHRAPPRHMDRTLVSCLTRNIEEGRLRNTSIVNLTSVPLSVAALFLSKSTEFPNLVRMRLNMNSSLFLGHEEVPLLGEESWRRPLHEALFRGLRKWSVDESKELIIVDDSERLATTEHFVTVFHVKGTELLIGVAIPHRRRRGNDGRFLSLLAVTFLQEAISRSWQAFCQRFVNLEVRLEVSTCQGVLDWWTKKLPVFWEPLLPSLQEISWDVRRSLHYNYLEETELKYDPSRRREILSSSILQHPCFRAPDARWNRLKIE